MSSVGTGRDFLAEIIARKRIEIERRRRHHRSIVDAGASEKLLGQRAIEALRRPQNGPLSIIAEVKFRSPSAGQIRPWSPGESLRVAHAYAENGAAVVSVLADAPGFGGCPQAVRRVAHAIDRPVLFKGFVLDEVQVDLAYAVGASLVLLLVRALSDEKLSNLIDRIRQRGMEPVVEAADGFELDRALSSGATIVGVNARDLGTFRVDMDAAARALQAVPAEKIAVFMSGVKTIEDFDRIAATRADAVLMGEVLMRADHPGQRLAQFGR